MRDCLRNWIITFYSIIILSGCAGTGIRKNLESKMNHAPVKEILADGRTNYKIPDLENTEPIYVGMQKASNGKFEYHVHLFPHIFLAGKKVNALVYTSKNQIQPNAIRIDWNNNWEYKLEDIMSLPGFIDYKGNEHSPGLILKPSGYGSLSNFMDSQDYQIADDDIGGPDGVFNEIEYGENCCKVPKWAMEK